MKLTRSTRLAAVLLLVASMFAIVVGCSDDDDGPSGTGTTGGAPTATSGTGSTGGGSTVSGTITMEGSSTVQPYTLEAIDAFRALYPNVRVNPPSGLGSGAGITAFINKEVDIAQSSRDITQDEIAQATAAGLDAFETTIFFDALAIVVNPNNPVDELTVEEVARIFAGEITNWSEVGGTGGEITIYTRNEESGTFAYMEEEVIQDILGDDAAYSDDINKQASAPAGLSAVAGDPRGIFYAGLGNLSEVPSGSIKTVRVAGESGTAVEATHESVADGSYPIARGLYYYTDGDPADSDNAALVAWFEFVLSEDGQAIGEELGFISIIGMNLGGPSGSTGSTGSTGGAAVTGEVSIEGSSTVQPVTLELIDLFNSEYPQAKVNPPSGLGSGAGITAFINKEVDIAQSSRPINDNERTQAAAAGLEVFETKIFDDALVIVVHPSNPVANLTVEQIARIFAGEITDWSEVGGTGGEITLYTRNEESGTFAYLEEEVIQDVLGDDAEYSDDINKQASAPAGLSAVSNDPSGIFYAGLGNIAEVPSGSVKVVTVEGVEATSATVADGSYPISRGLFYYTNGNPSASANAALKAFIELALSEEGQALGEELGFIPVN